MPPGAHAECPGEDIKPRCGNAGTVFTLGCDSKTNVLFELQSYMHTKHYKTIYIIPYIYTMQSILKPYLLYDHVYATCIITHLSVVVRQVSLRRDLLFKDDAAVPRRRYRQPPELMAKFGRKTMHPLQPYSMRFELRYSCCLIPPLFDAHLQTLEPFKL